MRLLPADEIAAVGDAPVTLKNGNEAHVTMHVLEGSREQIETQLRDEPGRVLRLLPGDLEFW